MNFPCSYAGPRHSLVVRESLEMGEFLIAERLKGMGLAKCLEPYMMYTVSSQPTEIVQMTKAVLYLTDSMFRIF